MTALVTNVLAADQYMGVSIPGRLFQGAYAQRGVHRLNLSRNLEDGGTLTSALVPWNTCGAYMAATLGVGTLAYLLTWRPLALQCFGLWALASWHRRPRRSLLPRGGIFRGEDSWSTGELGECAL